MSGVKALRAAWTLLKSDSRRETYAALAIVGVAVAPAVYGAVQERRAA